MKVSVFCLCGLLLAALPAAAGDLQGDYDRQVDKSDLDGSDLDSSGMDVGLDSAGLSEGDDFSGMDGEVEIRDSGERPEVLAQATRLDHGFGRHVSVRLRGICGGAAPGVCLRSTRAGAGAKGSPERRPTS